MRVCACVCVTLIDQKSNIIYFFTVYKNTQFVHWALELNRVLMRVKIGLWFLWSVGRSQGTTKLLRSAAAKLNLGSQQAAKVKVRFLQLLPNVRRLELIARGDAELYFVSGDETVVCACVDWDALMLEETSRDRNGSWTTVSGKFWTLRGAMEKMKKGQLCVVIRMMSPHGSLSQNTNFTLDFL